jgi:hypothetical protein
VKLLLCLLQCTHPWLRTWRNVVELIKVFKKTKELVNFFLSSLILCGCTLDVLWHTIRVLNPINANWIE